MKESWRGDLHLMKQVKWVLVGVVMMTLAACATGQKDVATAPEETGKPLLVMSKGNDYHVYKHEGRLYVIGSQEMSKQFAEQGHLPYTRTVIGGGPNGETVVYEIKKKEPAYTDRLMATFKAQ